MEATQPAKETTVVDLGALLDDGDDAVVTLVAGETRLLAHRAVLMDRSPVFAAVFRHDTLETRSWQVTIADVEGPVLRQLLSYLYTLRLTQVPGMRSQLLAAVEKYGVGSLKALILGESMLTESEELSAMEAIQNTKETTTVDLGALLDACDDAVVTLVAGETRLVAHRAVLMDRSPVFNAMFRHDTLESRSGQVTIVDVEGPVLQQLLSYLYTLRLPQLPGMAPQLLVAADKYGLDSLKAACEQQVAAQLSVETAAAAAVVAVRHSCESLRQASIRFLKDHTHQVMATRGWADAMHSQPDDLTEVNRLLVAEFRRLPADEMKKRLGQAAQEGSVGELEALQAAGADVVACGIYNNAMTALHCAADRGHVEAARWLLARDTRLNATTIWRGTPLHGAADRGHAAVVRLLLAASADHSARDCNGYTPLHCASRNGHAEAAAALLEAGANRWARDNWGKTPLDHARKKNHHQLVALLTRT